MQTGADPAALPAFAKATAGKPNTLPNALDLEDMIIRQSICAFVMGLVFCSFSAAAAEMHFSAADMYKKLKQIDSDTAEFIASAQANYDYREKSDTQDFVSQYMYAVALFLSDEKDNASEAFLNCFDYLTATEKETYKHNFIRDSFGKLSVIVLHKSLDHVSIQFEDKRFVQLRLNGLEKDRFGFGTFVPMDNLVGMFVYAESSPNLHTYFSSP